jgi:ABC-type transport system involved in multi-copper enzyme maturation permease subunit
MVSPVFSLEVLLGSRRSRLARVRRFYAGWLIVQFAVFLGSQFFVQRSTVEEADFLASCLWIFGLEHFFLLLFVTPAFLAGTITDEKLQGTMTQLLTADLTPSAIVAGKYLGRMSQVLLIVLASWPILAFLAGYGRRGPLAVVGLVAVTVLLLFFLGAISLWASVRSRQTREAVVRVYLWVGVPAVLVGLLLEWAIPWFLLMSPPLAPRRQFLLQADGWLRSFSPLYVLEPVWNGNDAVEFLRRFGFVTLLLGGIGVACLVLSVWQLRPSTIRQLEGRRRFRRARWRRPMGADPVRWRERTAGRGLRRWLGMAAVAAATYYAADWIYAQNEPSYYLYLGGAAGLLASLLAGIRASGTVSGERERKTWESLLLTPLDTWDILYDKLFGILESLYPYLFAFALPAVAMAYRDGGVPLTYTICSSLLAWAMMYYMAATGVWCSTSSRGSWRSLVATLGTGYSYFLVLATLFGLLFLWLGCTIVPIIVFFVRLAGVGEHTVALTIGITITAAVGMAWTLYRRSENKISDARTWIDSEERYGRTFTRSLTRALRKHYEQLAERKKKPETADAPAQPAG